MKHTSKLAVAALGMLQGACAATAQGPAAPKASAALIDATYAQPGDQPAKTRKTGLTWLRLNNDSVSAESFQGDAFRTTTRSISFSAPAGSFVGVTCPAPDGAVAFQNISNKFSITVSAGQDQTAEYKTTVKSNDVELKTFPRNATCNVGGM
jgi:hypothetical protein